MGVKRTLQYLTFWSTFRAKDPPPTLDPPHMPALPTKHFATGSCSPSPLFLHSSKSFQTSRQGWRQMQVGHGKCHTRFGCEWKLLVVRKCLKRREICCRPICAYMLAHCTCTCTCDVPAHVASWTLILQDALEFFLIHIKFTKNILR